MHPADIKALIEKAGSSQTAIAQSMKGRGGQQMRVATVHAVIKGLGKSQRVARAISVVTGRPVKELWPGKYPDLEKNQAIEARGGRAAVLQASLQSTTAASEKKRA